MKTLSEQSLSQIKKGIWVYFILLIFEGALRKWGIPQLSTPLLIIRDPVALWVMYKAYNRNIFPSNIYITTIIIIGFISIITALAFGHGSFIVAMYGARILLIHFPFMFVMGKVMDRKDVISLGRTLLIISIPMVLLIALQFYSPQSSLVNRGVGGDMAGSGFSGAMGFFRPSGTFSFTSGSTFFFNLVAVFVIYFWMNPKGISLSLLIGSTAAVLISIPLSISRGLFFSIAVTILFALIGALSRKKYTGKILVAGVIMVFGILILSQLSFFQTATAAFTERFTNANTSEGGLSGVFADRYLGGLISALESSADQSFFGYGIGMGTNAGSKLLTGNVMYLVSEGEWGRVIGEEGALLGLSIIFVRLALCFKLALIALSKMKQGDILPWVLLSISLLVIPQGQWAQPTSLGFSTIIGGLIIASFKHNDEKEDFTVQKEFAT